MTPNNPCQGIWTYTLLFLSRQSFYTVAEYEIGKEAERRRPTRGSPPGRLPPPEESHGPTPRPPVRDTVTAQPLAGCIRISNGILLRGEVGRVSIPCG